MPRPQSVIIISSTEEDLLDDSDVVYITTVTGEAVKFGFISPPPKKDILP